MTTFDPSIMRIVQDSDRDPFEFLDYLWHADRGPEDALVYSKLIWPDLIEVDGYVFLKEYYHKEYFDEVLANYGPGSLEETINTVYLDLVVGAGPIDYTVEVWEALGRVLCETWKQRALSQFPHKSFKTEFAWYSDDGDPGVKLYQPNLKSASV